jgi:putative heme iron utilization protein
VDGPSQCHALAARARYGALATIAREHPFATLVALAFDARRRPLLCLSELAEHTKNLFSCPNASILVTEGATGADPLASGRMTLVGRCARVGLEEAEAARDAFLAVHAEAAGYAKFKDFAMWRLEVQEVRWVGGFGRMEWVPTEAYAGQSTSS